MDLELPHPLTKKEKRITKRKKNSSTISNPTKSAGRVPDLRILVIICKNKTTPNTNGMEIVPVNENAETKGMLKM